MGNTNINIPDYLKEEAKKQHLNISEISASALRDKLGKVRLEIDSGDSCGFCGNLGERETRENLGLKKTSLTWLFPDEKWICNSCLKIKCDKIIHGSTNV